MSEASEQKSYQEVLSEANAQAANSVQTPLNYFSDLPLRTGIIAGIVGSVGIIVVIGLLALATGRDPFLSPQVISSVILGASAFDGGILPTIVGTIMHFGAGAIYGAIFALVVPKMPRGFWFVAGLVYAMLIWGIAALALPLLLPPNEIPPLDYTNAQIVSHLTYGITLGVAGAYFGNITSEAQSD